MSRLAKRKLGISVRQRLGAAYAAGTLLCYLCWRPTSRPAPGSMGVQPGNGLVCELLMAVLGCHLPAIGGGTCVLVLGDGKLQIGLVCGL